MSRESPRFALPRAAWALLLVSIGLGCTQRKGVEPPSDPNLALTLPGGAERVAELLQIEARGDVEAIGSEDIGHPLVVVRRASARALARIADIRAYPKLLSALSDEDPETIAFAAHGLSRLCDAEGANPREITGALVARSISLASFGEAPLDPSLAISRALADCATKEGEPTLAAWLDRPAPWNASAALALAALASRKKELSEPTQEALVAAAMGSLDEALLALGRVDRVSSSLQGRLLEAARSRLDGKGSSFVVRALGKVGADAAPDLARVLKKEAGDFDAAARSEAARALGRMGESGERDLAEALVLLMPKEGSLEELGTDAFGPLLTTVEMLRGAHPWAEKPLRAIASLSIPDDASASLSRRITRLRCAALGKLSKKGVKNPELARCSPAPADAALKRAKVEAVDPGGGALGWEQPIRLSFVTDAGSASILLDPKLAPASVHRFVELARQGAYDGVPIQRVVPGSFVQIGPAQEGETRPPLPRETAPIAFQPFTVGVALDEDRETGSDKLFVTLTRLPELDGQYTWLGRAEPAFATLAEGDVIERVIVATP